VVVNIIIPQYTADFFHTPPATAEACDHSRRRVDADIWHWHGLLLQGRVAITVSIMPEKWSCRVRHVFLERTVLFSGIGKNEAWKEKQRVLMRSSRSDTW
jgi:hypothetical protein